MTVRTLLIGAGGMARSHLPLMIQHGAQIVAVCEPSQEQYALTCERLRTGLSVRFHLIDLTLPSCWLTLRGNWMLVRHHSPLLASRPKRRHA
jgi:hypothetical protein